MTVIIIWNILGENRKPTQFKNIYFALIFLLTIMLRFLQCLDHITFTLHSVTDRPFELFILVRPIQLHAHLIDLIQCQICQC
ncbi:hypothetical protein FGO68_gene12438 [Halteria grandinella]|uniref:Uncharacterized protein n=1 Tax=Halteria grandinella TaxID=5974 RepID=A0A8J8NPW8_HALGN|nr:hypothetical protein FGO68_gene12438 [Halteria grandinella]